MSCERKLPCHSPREAEQAVDAARGAPHDDDVEVLDGREVAPVDRLAASDGFEAVRVAGLAVRLRRRAALARGNEMIVVPKGGRCRRNGTPDEPEGARGGFEGVLVADLGVRVNPLAMPVVSGAVRIDDLAVRSRELGVHSCSDAGRERRVGTGARQRAVRADARAVRGDCLEVRCGRRAECSRLGGVRCGSPQGRDSAVGRSFSSSTDLARAARTAAQRDRGDDGLNQGRRAGLIPEASEWYARFPS
jgi:hypothetical protein